MIQVAAPRLALTRASEHVLQQYGEQTRDVVAGVAARLQPIFAAQERGDLGSAVASHLQSLFALWCEQSGVVPPATARRLLARQKVPSAEGVARLLRTDLGFPAVLSRASATAFVANLRAGARKEDALSSLVNMLYAPSVEALCLQSAHVSLARAVFYRVLEDQQLAQERISGNALRQTLEAATKRLVGAEAAPAFQMLEEMRSASESFMPLLYELRQLDWWLIPGPRLPSQQQAFDNLLAPLEVELQRMLALLDSYEFAAVDRDVWKDVYQHHLPWEERQRLGGFYTPDAFVELVLDVAGWRVDEDLEGKRIADIACGSGTFLVEALRRRRAHLERAALLPQDPTPDQLDDLLQPIIGFDIHPFATFLATTNLVFQVIDLYRSVRHRHPTYSLPVNVFTVDSLAEQGLHARQAKLMESIPDDIRIHHTSEEIERYRGLLKERFDVVVGNPPWGGILKGRLSPLFDPDKREEYRTSGRFESATDKFDVYTLFIERSLQWLKRGGRYSLLTPNTYRDKDFGSGIRAVLADRAAPSLIIDVGPYGQLLFGAMNTPSITSGTAPPSYEKLVVVAADRGFPFVAPPRDRVRRQRELAQAVTRAASTEKPSTKVRVWTEPIDEVQSWGSHHWHLHALRPYRLPLEGVAGYPAGDLFE